jgi:transposase
MKLLFRGVTSNFSPTQLVFVDETSVQGKALRRKYGWCFQGAPAFADVNNAPHGEDTACAIAAIDYSGVFSISTFEKTLGSDEFLQVLCSEILPGMNSFPNPRSVLVMDNARTHPHDIIFEECRKRNIVCLFLPPYSYDLNPIELVFHDAKQFLRKKYRIESGYSADKLREGLSRVPSNNIRAYYHHCGYH